MLLAHDWPPETRLFICARLSYEDEQIVATTLSGAQELPEMGGVILIAVDETEEKERDCK